MFEDLILVHRSGGQKSSTLADDLRLSLGSNMNLDTRASHTSVQDLPLQGQAVFVWQTCLRQISLIDEKTLENLRPILAFGDEIYHGDAAYRFLLQVICGLHSPLIGETEVYGQFKNAVQNFGFPLTPWGTRLRRFFKTVFEEAKKIRQENLEDLGSQSYGSVVRRELKDLRQIHVLGAGQLVQEILPWILNEKREIRISARSPDRAHAALSVAMGDSVSAKQISVHELVDPCWFPIEALIVAAPIEVERILSWLGEQRPKLIIDLRADSNAAQFKDYAERCLSLTDIFGRISENQTLIEQRKLAALAMIEASAVERSFHVEYRPFGWEDVCA